MRDRNLRLRCALRAFVVFVALARLCSPSNGSAQSPKASAEGKTAAVLADEAMTRQARRILAELPLRFNPTALRLAIDDMAKAYPAKTTRRNKLLKKLDQLEKALPGLKAQLGSKDIARMKEGLKTWKAMEAFKRNSADR